MRLTFLPLWMMMWPGSAVNASAVSDPLSLRPVRYELTIDVDLTFERMRAVATIRLRNENAVPVKTASLLLYRLLTVQAVRNSTGAALSYRQRVVAFEDDSKLQVNHVVVSLDHPLAPGRETTLSLDYEGHLLGYSETGMRYVRDRIDTAYTLIRKDAYAYPELAYPSRTVNRRAELPAFAYQARIIVPTSYRVANGGALVQQKDTVGKRMYVYRSLTPSWRMDFAIAPFDVLQNGELTVFHLPADSSGAQRIMDAIARTRQLYTRWFGPPRGSAAFAVIEVPDGWGSQTDVSSVLQTAAAFRDPRRETELYHEIAHLWSVAEDERPSARWEEGLATFLEDVTADSVKATATMDANAVRMAQWLRTRVARDSLLKEVPMAQYGKREMTDYSYSVGSIMFFALYRVVGHEEFCRIVREYGRRHRSGGGGSVALARVAQEVSTHDLAAVFTDWLFTTGWTDVVENAKSAGELYARYRKAPPS